MFETSPGSADKPRTSEVRFPEPRPMGENKNGRKLVNRHSGHRDCGGDEIEDDVKAALVEERATAEDS